MADADFGLLSLEKLQFKQWSGFYYQEIIVILFPVEQSLLKRLYIVHPLLSQRGFFKLKIKPAKRPCTYYSNSSATFHRLLEGNLVFKLNSGPSNNEVGSCQRQRIPPLNYARNPENLNSITREPVYKISNSLSLCLLNAQSVKNKSGNIFDCVIECKADLVAITETWLKRNSDVS